MLPESEKKIGQVFHELRVQKGFKVINFEAIGVSDSTICRFEKGQSSIGMDKFFRALNFMDISLSEFEHFYCNIETELSLDNLNKIKQLYFELNLPELEKCLENTFNPILRIAIKSLTYLVSGVGKISKDEEEFLLAYLLDIKLWGTYELYILTFVIRQLSKRHVLLFLDEILENTPTYQKNIYYRRLILQLYIHGAFRLITLRDKKKSKEILDFVANFSREDNLFHRTLCLFFTGYYEVTFVNKNEGEIKMMEAISIFRSLQSPRYANFLDSILRK